MVTTAGHGSDGQSRIVVGIDGSPESTAALDWAIAEAAMLHGRLDVVHAWSSPYAYSPMGVGTVPVDTAAIEADAKELVGEGVDAALARATTRPAEVHQVVVEGPPAPTLLRHAVDADLLVVGTRGRGGMMGLVLGSVSRQCTHHAPCPVVVVPLPAGSVSRRP